MNKFKLRVLKNKAFISYNEQIEQFLKNEIERDQLYRFACFYIFKTTCLFDGLIEKASLIIDRGK